MSKFCIYCGALLVPEAAYCGVCGREILGKEEVKKAHPYSHHTSFPQEAPSTPDQGIPFPHQPTMPVTAPITRYSGSFLSRLVDVISKPRDAFRSIPQTPEYKGPFLVSCASALSMTLVYAILAMEMGNILTDTMPRDVWDTFFISLVLSAFLVPLLLILLSTTLLSLLLRIFKKKEPFIVPFAIVGYATLPLTFNGLMNVLYLLLIQPEITLPPFDPELLNSSSLEASQALIGIFFGAMESGTAFAGSEILFFAGLFFFLWTIFLLYLGVVEGLKLEKIQSFGIALIVGLPIFLFI